MLHRPVFLDVCGPVGGRVGAVGRRTSIWPLTGGYSNDQEAIVRSASAVIGCWRNRVPQIASPTWLTESGKWACINCFPVGVEASPVTETCKKAYICPFCWGRQAQDVYRRIRDVLFGAPENQRKNYWLTAYKSRLDFHCHPYRTMRTLRQKLGTARRYQLELFRYLGAFGGFSLTTLEPRTGDQWRLTNQGLFLSGGRLALRQLEPKIPHVFKEARSPKRSEIVRLVRWALRYPKALLVADSARVRQFMEARRGFRLAATYGELRKLNQILT